MTIEEQVQFLKDQGVWEDLLIEIGEGNIDRRCTPNNIVDMINWGNTRQGHDFWYDVYKSVSYVGPIYDIETPIEQWKKENPEYFV